MECKAGTLLFVIVITLEHAMAAITVRPNDTEVIIGSSTYLNCSTSLSKDVHWYHYPTGTQPAVQKYVYAYNQWYSPYKDRLQLQKNESLGSYNLFIPSVEVGDAGVFACQDNEGSGETAPAELTVLESSPMCSSTMKPDGVIGVNSCKKEPEILQLSCSVSYRGKDPPLLEWRNIDGNASIAKGVTTDTVDNRITSYLTLMGEPSIDGASFVCQTSKAHYHCISSAVRIMYAINGNEKRKAQIGETVVCKANASQECTYKWKWFKNDDTLTVSNTRTLIPKQSGDFRCEAECFIRKEPCPIIAMFAYVEGGNTTLTTEDSSLSSGYIALIVCLILLLITTVIIIVACFTRRRRRKKRRLHEEIHDLEKVRLNEKIPIPETERLLQAFDENSDKSDSSASDFSKLTTLLGYIDKGATGEFYGPCQFKDMTCAFQRIMYSTSKLTTEKEKSEIIDKGNRWKDLDNANVVKFYRLRFESPALYILMEYAAGGTVRKALDLSTEELPSDVTTDWALQIANGMQFLHEQGIIHSHLKSAQVLIMEPFDPSDSSNKTLKIASYRISAQNVQSAPGSFKGTFAWESPESIELQKFSKSRDIWSYGVTIWEILTKNIPYRGMKNAAIISNVMAGNKDLAIPMSCTPVLHEIIKSCWKIEPDQRPSFSDIVSNLKDGRLSLKDAKEIPEFLTRLPYIDKGACGEIFGPFLYQGKNCACERIMYSPAKVSSISADEICHQGRRWMELEHRNVIRFYDVRFQNPTLYVVMEYAGGGSIRKVLDSWKEDLEVSVVMDWATQIANGMNYLHDKEIVHERLKASQILIMEPFSATDSLRKTLKIGSFSLTKDSQSVPVSFKGMFAWMAPETIQDSKDTCKASDVWSYGVTVWEILTKEIPYRNEKQSVMIRTISQGESTLSIPSRCPQTICDVLKGCWIRDTEKRPTFPEILTRLHATDG